MLKCHRDYLIGAITAGDVDPLIFSRLVSSGVPNIITGDYFFIIISLRDRDLRLAIFVNDITEIIYRVANDRFRTSVGNAELIDNRFSVLFINPRKRMHRVFVSCIIYNALYV